MGKTTAETVITKVMNIKVDNNLTRAALCVLTCVVSRIITSPVINITIKLNQSSNKS